MARPRKLHPFAAPIVPKPGEKLDPLVTDGLRWSQREFVYAYIDTGDRLSSAKKARPDLTDDKDLHQWAWKTLQLPTVQTVLNILMNRRYQSVEWVLNKLGSIAAASISSCVNVEILEGGKEKISLDWGKAVELGALDQIKSLEFNPDGTLKKFTLKDDLKAIEIILRYHGKLDGANKRLSVEEIVQLCVDSGRPREQWPEAVRAYVEKKERQALLSGPPQMPKTVDVKAIEEGDECSSTTPS